MGGQPRQPVGLRGQLDDLEAQRAERQADLDALPDTVVNASARAEIQAEIDALDAKIDPLRAAIQQIKNNLGGVLTDAKIPSSPSQDTLARNGAQSATVARQTTTRQTRPSRSAAGSVSLDAATAMFRPALRPTLPNL